MGALYRPGPLTAGLTDRFIARKNGTEKVSYEHELMKPGVESTYGVLVYQEQVMRIARDMCGFSGGQADTLRKAIGKKKVDLMEKKCQIKYCRNLAIIWYNNYYFCEFHYQQLKRRD